MMRYKDVLAQCSQQRNGLRHNVSMECAAHIAFYHHDDSPAALAFRDSGTITLPYEELWEHFFPNQRRSDAEWTVARAFYDYLYSRRNRTEGPATWTQGNHPSKGATPARR